MKNCSKPPKGWKCSRKPNHQGPCAASPQSGIKLITIFGYIWLAVIALAATLQLAKFVFNI